MTPAERAKAFVDEILIPRAIDAELGRITREDVGLIRREPIAREISGSLHAGSDPSGITTTATRVDGGWRLDGEKWFVTYGDVAAVYIVMALASSPTLFLVEAGLPGISVWTTRRSPTPIRTDIPRSSSRAWSSPTTP